MRRRKFEREREREREREKREEIKEKLINREWGDVSVRERREKRWNKRKTNR